MSGTACGTHAGYHRHRRNHEAACDPCMTAYRRYVKRWRLERDRSGPRVVPADQVRDHVRSLMGGGMSLSSIAKFAGVSPSTLANTLARPGSGINRRTADAVLAVTGPDYDASPDEETFVPRVGAVRRIQALLALGWTHEHMREHCGIRTHTLMSQEGSWVTLRNHNRVRAMYERLSMTPGPSALTRARAAKAGYVPPLAWDDTSIDDPSAWADLGDEHAELIDEIEIDRFISGDLPWQAITKAGRLHAALVMQDLGYSRKEIHARCHINQQELTAALNAARHAA